MNHDLTALASAIKTNLTAVMADFFDGQYNRAHDFDKIVELQLEQFTRHGDNNLYEFMQWAIDQHFSSDNRNSPRYWFHSTMNERLCDVAIATLQKHKAIEMRPFDDPDSWWWNIELPA